jgi:hypothetical protein
MSSQGEAPSEYQSYLLRLWRTHSDGAPVWRASLENPLTQEVVRFAGLASLFAFLLAQTGPGSRDDGWDGKPPPEI